MSGAHAANGLEGFVDRTGRQAISIADQAAGLRALVGNRPTQVIAFAAGSARCGRTTLAVEAARALARMKHRVVLVDENESTSNAMTSLAAESTGDLLDALMVGTPLGRLINPVDTNLWVVPAAKAAALLRYDVPRAEEVAAQLMMPMEAAANFILIDSMILEGGHLSVISAQAHHVIVVVAAETDAITRAYAVIKRLVKERGRDGFHLAVTKARSESEAATIYDNVKGTAEKHLGVRVEYFGSLSFPLKSGIGHALLSRLPIASASTTSRYGRPTQRDG